MGLPHPSALIVQDITHTHTHTVKVLNVHKKENSSHAKEIGITRSVPQNRSNMARQTREAATPPHSHSPGSWDGIELGN